MDIYENLFIFYIVIYFFVTLWNICKSRWRETLWFVWNSLLSRWLTTQYRNFYYKNIKTQITIFINSQSPILGASNQVIFVFGSPNRNNCTRNLKGKWGKIIKKYNNLVNLHKNYYSTSTKLATLPLKKNV